MIPRYRGLSIDEKSKGEWQYGHLIEDRGRAFIINQVIEANEQYITIGSWCPVNSATLGQSTGLVDKNGEEIFEGDVVSRNSGMPSVVEFGKWIYEEDFGYKIKNIGFYLNSSYDDDEFFQAMDYEDIRKNFEIIGNIYENPELLMGK